MTDVHQRNSADDAALELLRRLQRGQADATGHCDLMSQLLPDAVFSSLGFVEGNVVVAACNLAKPGAVNLSLLPLHSRGRQRCAAALAAQHTCSVHASVTAARSLEYLDLAQAHRQHGCSDLVCTAVVPPCQPHAPQAAGPTAPLPPPGAASCPGASSSKPGADEPAGSLAGLLSAAVDAPASGAAALSVAFRGRPRRAALQGVGELAAALGPLVAAARAACVTQELRSLVLGPAGLVAGNAAAQPPARPSLRRVHTQLPGAAAKPATAVQGGSDEAGGLQDPCRAPPRDPREPDASAGAPVLAQAPPDCPSPPRRAHASFNSLMRDSAADMTSKAAANARAALQGLPYVPASPLKFRQRRAAAQQAQSRGQSPELPGDHHDRLPHGGRGARGARLWDTMGFADVQLEERYRRWLGARFIRWDAYGSCLLLLAVLLDIVRLARPGAAAGVPAEAWLTLALCAAVLVLPAAGQLLAPRRYQRCREALLCACCLAITCALASGALPYGLAARSPVGAWLPLALSAAHLLAPLPSSLVRVRVFLPKQLAAAAIVAIRALPRACAAPAAAGVTLPPAACATLGSGGLLALGVAAPALLLWRSEARSRQRFGRAGAARAA